MEPFFFGGGGGRHYFENSTVQDYMRFQRRSTFIDNNVLGSLPSFFGRASVKWKGTVIGSEQNFCQRRVPIGK